MYSFKNLKLSIHYKINNILIQQNSLEFLLNIALHVHAV